jgi:hypothetical protein
MHVDVIELRKRLLGAEHPDTMAHLVATYRQQGKWNKAETSNINIEWSEILKRGYKFGDCCNWEDILGEIKLGDVITLHLELTRDW